MCFKNNIFQEILKYAVICIFEMHVIMYVIPYEICGMTLVRLFIRYELRVL
jgi:hypothetical protein